MKDLEVVLKRVQLKLWKELFFIQKIHKSFFGCDLNYFSAFIFYVSV